MMPGSKKGQSVLEANRKVSRVDLSVTCNDVFDAQHDDSVVRVSQSRDNRPKFEPRCFDENPADYPQFVKEFEITLSSFLLNDEVKLMNLGQSSTIY
ncbi:unnamed protein product [Trichobilharzia regenti]|nr:unnamed protein product [Trichobilharzia regenti]